MATILQLPYEILVNIFDQMDNVAQLATCRLVCQRWNYPAEKAMFGKEIPIKSEEQAFELYEHLCKDPCKGRLIKHMDFNIETLHLPLIYTYLLRLAFTPTIERLTGTVRAPRFYTTLMDIAGNNYSQFTQFKLCPKGCKLGFRAWVEFMAKFDSLQLCYSFRPSTLDNRLLDPNRSIKFIMEDAPKLKNLLFDKCFTRGWRDMEASLKHCPNLEVLLILHYTPERRQLSRSKIHSWVISANVSKVLSLKTLWLKTSDLFPGMIEYLMYKYPNVRFLKLRCSPIDVNPNELKRVLNAIHRVEKKNVTFWFPADVSMDELMQFAATRSETITFQMEATPGGGNSIAMKIN